MICYYCKAKKVIGVDTRDKDICFDCACTRQEKKILERYLEKEKNNGKKESS